MADNARNVLFLCTGNSARSILAECLMTRLGQGRFRGVSAGSTPTGEVNPFALELLGREGFDVGGLRSKTWDEFARADAPFLDFVFTVCDNAAHEVCPIWPGRPATAHWGMPDPAAVQGDDERKRTAFGETYRILGRRIGVFVDLPFSTLDETGLRARLRDIGSGECD